MKLIGTKKSRFAKKIFSDEKNREIARVRIMIQFSIVRYIIFQPNKNCETGPVNIKYWSFIRCRKLREIVRVRNRVWSELEN